MKSISLFALAATAVATPHTLMKRSLDAPDANSMVFYYETVLPGGEAEHAAELGYTVVVPTEAEWAAMTVDNFKSFKAIVFGDPHCHTDEDNKLSGAEANKAVWSAAVSGNMVVNSFDPSWHHEFGSDEPEASAFMLDTLDYVGSGAGTGFYMSTSCYRFTDDAYDITVLSEFGTFTVDEGFHGDDLTITDPGHPSVDTLSDSLVSDWGSSVHNYFVSYPGDFHEVIQENDTGHSVLVVRDGGEAGFSCDGKPIGYQECDVDDINKYNECAVDGYHHRDVAPGTDCCNWSAAQRIILVMDDAWCPFDV